MHTNFSNLTIDTCENCGLPILGGDLVYHTKDNIIHDECFYDYIKNFVLDNGWKRTVYGDEENIDY